MRDLSLALVCLQPSEDGVPAAVVALRQEAEPAARYVTLTVVVRCDGTEGEPCEQGLAEHPDVMFVGSEDGVTGRALALGAYPDGWA